MRRNEPAERRVVWARGNVATEECPKSYITAESLAWVEEFQVWKRLGYPRVEEMTARQVEAMLVLEAELAEEMRRGQE
ncbi:MAG TPA: hypothetical protein PK157_12835 [Bryobacteraceae bacterium]|nr:hypothetical protein [Bryobacteraceae bacterium]